MLRTNAKNRLSASLLSLVTLTTGLSALSIAGCSSAPESAPAENIDTAGMTFEEWLSTLPYHPETGAYIVEGDIAMKERETLEDYYVNYVRGGALIVNGTGVVPQIWNDTRKMSLRYCVSNAFGFVDKVAVVDAMEVAAKSWESVAKVDFIHEPAFDGNCTDEEVGVLGLEFNVRPANNTPIIEDNVQVVAAAFYPGVVASDRHIYIDMAAPLPVNTDLDGVLRHELGHVLGFRHEFDSSSNVSLCMKDFDPSKALTPYDSISAMNYPQCGGPSWNFALSAADDYAAGHLYGVLYNEVTPWGGGNFANGDGWNLNPAYWQTIQFPDLTGDGNADICGRSKYGIWCGVSNGTTFTGHTHWISPTFSDDHGWAANPAYWKTIRFPDVNGDGKADVCGRGNGGITCALSNGATQFAAPSLWTPKFNDNDGWAASPDLYETIQYVRLDNNSSYDICGRGNGGIWCAKSNGPLGGFGTVTLWASSFSNATGMHTQPSYWKTIRFPDVSGDGRPDVCGRTSNGIFCAISNGTSAFTSPSLWTSAFKDDDGWMAHPSYWETIQFPDVDGDGKADVCGRGEQGIWCAKSTGSSFGTVTKWGESFSNSLGWNADPSRWRTIQFPDVNADGRADVCGRHNDGIVCAISNGMTFGKTDISTPGQFTNANGWSLDASQYELIKFPNLNTETKKQADVCGRDVGGFFCALMK